MNVQKFSLQAQLEEVDRELEMRGRVYPSMVARRQMRDSVSRMHIARLEAVRKTLAWLQENETAIKAALGQK